MIKKIGNVLNKVYKGVKQYKVVIIALCLAPILIGFFTWLPIFNFDNGSNDGWLGFWGGYLTSIITIAGVYWQVRKQSEEARQNLLETFANEEIRETKRARPTFICELTEQSLLGEEYYLNIAPGSQPEGFIEWVKNSNPIFTVVKIQNIGKQAILNARMKLIYNRKHTEDPTKLEWVIIKKILPGESYIYVPKGTQTSSKDAQDISNIDIWFNTASGEEVEYEMIDNFNNGMFNTLAVVSRIDHPNASNFEDNPPRNTYDGVGKNTEYE